MTSARDKALSYLAKFARTERQVAEYLKRKGFSPDEISETIAYLRERSFLNDTAFAESYIQTRIRRGDGPLKIKQLLFAKGIAPADVDSLLRELYPAEAQVLCARALIRKKPRLERLKLMRFLASRGFPRQIIFQSLAEN